MKKIQKFLFYMLPFFIGASLFAGNVIIYQDPVSGNSAQYYTEHLNDGTLFIQRVG